MRVVRHTMPMRHRAHTCRARPRPPNTTDAPSAVTARATHTTRMCVCARTHTPAAAVAGHRGMASIPPPTTHTHTHTHTAHTPRARTHTRAHSQPVMAPSACSVMCESCIDGHRRPCRAGSRCRRRANLRRLHATRSIWRHVLPWRTSALGRALLPRAPHTATQHLRASACCRGTRPAACAPAQQRSPRAGTRSPGNRRGARA